MSLDINLHCDCCGQTVAEINLTHNLRDMAEAAGLYDTLWGPYDSADRTLFIAKRNERKHLATERTPEDDNR